MRDTKRVTKRLTLATVAVGFLLFGRAGSATPPNHCAPGALDASLGRCACPAGYSATAAGSPRCVPDFHPPGAPPSTSVGHVEQISLGTDFSCARLSDGTVKCWGASDHGQVADGMTGGFVPPGHPNDRHQPMLIRGLSHVTQIAVGGHHACALLADGTAKCWGENAEGQLGDGTTQWRLAPTPVVALDHVVQLAAGYRHTCARLESGTIKCWGYNLYGQVGDGTTTDATRPALVPNLTNVAQVAAGSLHTCVRMSDATVRCWGSNQAGQLGDGTVATAAEEQGRCGAGPRTPTSCPPVPHPVPTPVPGLANVVELALGSGPSVSSCARLTDGTVSCWGAWSATNVPVSLGGVVGAGGSSGSLTPTPMTGVTSAASVAVGPAHACARLANGTVTCWGNNTFGQLGDGTVSSRPTPARVPILTGVTQVAAGGLHTCAVMAGGSLSC
jgi:alpha-tubulin suppressor-like RCC1 family protein